MSKVKLWASSQFWKKTAIWVTTIMFLILIYLSFDSVSKISVGTKRVPPYSIINNKIFYTFDEDRNKLVPIIGEEAPLFNNKLNEQDAEKLVNLGKLTIQSKNCMNCHTLLGNGAYYAPDLTKSWLDKSWIDEEQREDLMVEFLMNPGLNTRAYYGSTRLMPNLEITNEEARGIVAYLKWMSSIDTNGFPAKFKSIAQEGDDQ